VVKELRKLFYSTQNACVNSTHLLECFQKRVEESYGFSYNNLNLDEVIDCLDYGGGEMTFNYFNRLMKKAISKRKKELGLSSKKKTENDYPESSVDKKKAGELK